MAFPVAANVGLVSTWREQTLESPAGSPGQQHTAELRSRGADVHLQQQYSSRNFPGLLSSFLLLTTQAGGGGEGPGGSREMLVLPSFILELLLCGKVQRRGGGGRSENSPVHGYVWRAAQRMIGLKFRNHDTSVLQIFVS